jgi:hypothetical protein
MMLTDREVALIVACIGPIVLVLEEEDLRLILEEIIAKRPKLSIWPPSSRIQHGEC